MELIHKVFAVIHHPKWNVYFLSFAKLIDMRTSIIEREAGELSFLEAQSTIGALEDIGKPITTAGEQEELHGVLKDDMA